MADWLHHDSVLGFQRIAWLAFAVLLIAENLLAHTKNPRLHSILSAIVTGLALALRPLLDRVVQVEAGEKAVRVMAKVVPGGLEEFKRGPKKDDGPAPPAAERKA